MAQKPVKQSESRINDIKRGSPRGSNRGSERESARQSPLPRGSLLLLQLAVAVSCLWSCGAPTPSAETLRARWHNNQGVVYMDQHNYTKGFEQFRAAVALDGDYATGHANLGIAYYSLGKYDSASVALQAALELDPGHLHALYTSGLIYHAHGKEEGYPKALAAFQRVASEDPDDPLVRYYLGRTLSKLGQHEEAIAEFRHASELDPHNVSAYYNLSNELRTLKRMDEWKATLEKFNELSQQGHEGVSASYQGQGRYSEALIDTCVDGSRTPDRLRQPTFSSAPVRLEGQPDHIGLVATVDLDTDGLTDLLIADGEGTLSFFRNRGDQTFSRSASGLLPALAELSEAGAMLDLVIGDVDVDGDFDLVVSGDAGTFMARQHEGLPDALMRISGPSTRAVFGDVDHDGDPDLLVIGESGKQLLVNDGTGTFTDRSQTSGLSTAAGSEAIFADFDNDRDVDFVAISAPLAAAGALELYTNNRDGTFSEVAVKQRLQPRGATDLVVGDFNADSYMDVVTIDGVHAPRLLTNQRGRSFTEHEVATATPGLAGIRQADIDNDGDLDLVVFGGAGLGILSQVDGEFVRHDLVAADSGPVDQLLVRDFDADGRVDLWAGSHHAGVAHIYRNETEAGHWVKLGLQGLNSNPNGFGTKVEVKTAYSQQKRELRGGSRDPSTLTFGLAEADSVEFIRVLWPSGVRQTELATSAGQRLSLTELNRKGTSCPILYAWDGEEFRFVSDFLGGAIIGYLLGPGEFFNPDSDEYLPVGAIAPLDGNYTFQIANQLEEVIYLDAVALVAVDHPTGMSVFANERLLSQSPYPDFGAYAIDELHLPRHAMDDHGRDVTQQLLVVDDDWYDGFEPTAIHGYAEPFSLVLDMGDLSAVASPVLIANGWVDYAHSSSNWAAAQQGKQLSPPRLEVGDGHGGWRLVTTDMGTPAGLPKYMTFDMKGQFTAGDYRLRISTNAAIYWDQVAIGSAHVAEKMVVHRRTFDAADLHWRGYPEHTPIKGTFAFRYHYERLNPYSDWGTHDGAFTRFGEVAELLDEVDDRFVIMFHGDELTVEVPAADFPALPPGKQRTFLLYADGFGKDMDYHSAHSLTVGPLPFHGMSNYPYSQTEAYPTDEQHVAYQVQYNTRVIRGYYE